MWEKNRLAGGEALLWLWSAGFPGGGNSGSGYGLQGRRLGLADAAGLLGMGGLAVLGLARLRPVRAFSLAVFVLRFAIALAVILVFGAVPVQDFQTMYDAACQMAQGGGDYLRTDYFYNWAYQTGFTAYESLVIRLFGEGLFPLQLCNALWMAGTGSLVYAIARRLLSHPPP